MANIVYTDSVKHASDTALSVSQVGADSTAGVQKVEQQFSDNYISTATTTVVKSGAGLLHTIVVQGGVAGTITIYDNTSATGTKIADFDSTNALNSYMFNCTFATGLTVVTAAATKVTINYR